MMNAAIKPIIAVPMRYAQILMARSIALVGKIISVMVSPVKV